MRLPWSPQDSGSCGHPGRSLVVGLNFDARESSCRARVVTIDPATGIATFSPLSLLTRRFYPPISVRDYSSVYGLMSGRGKAYNVELSNYKGDSILLFYKIQKKQAENACAVISERFGLTNRGLV